MIRNSKNHKITHPQITMKPYLLLTGILWVTMTATLFAEPLTARYITHKSVRVTARQMNNAVAVMESEGIKFVIPEGAIETIHLVEVYREEGTLTVKSGKPGKHIARLQVDTPKFNLPVEVHIPMTNPAKVPIAYAVDVSDAWVPLTFLKLSPDKTTAIYVTYKPVTVAWVTPE